MAGLIDDLLTHAVAEAGAMAAGDVLLSGPDGALVAGRGSAGPDDVSRSRTRACPRCTLDEAALRQVFANLVGNPSSTPVRACRRSPRGRAPGLPRGGRGRGQRLGVEEHERYLI